MAHSRLLANLDRPTIMATVALVTVGVLAIASATHEQSGREDLWKMQVAWFIISMAAAAVIVMVDYHVWAGVALLLHSVVVILLVAVLFVGREIGGNKSWLILGPMRLQPSELAKWTTCLIVAVYLARRHTATIGLRQMLEIGVLVGVPACLILLQPDWGTVLTFIPIFLAGLWLGGLRMKVIAGVLIVGLLLAPVLWVQLKPYQKERILTVLDTDRDPSGVGYQVRQSKIAIGSGGFSGKGWFQGTQSQLNYLPAQHTDFIMSVIAEDLGFLGVLGVLGLFYFLSSGGSSPPAPPRTGWGCTCVCSSSSG